MEKKPQEQPSRPVKPQKRNDGILLPVLIAAVAGFACFLIVLGVGGMVLPTQTAENPAASPSNRGKLPTEAPPNNKPPAQTKPPEATQTRAPATQDPGPIISVQPTVPTSPPAQQTQRPAQTGSQGGGSGTVANGDGTYTHDFSGGRMLGTINSDKYHCYDCRAAKTIPPENCVWYNSENDAIAASRSRCGICWR